MLNLMAMLTFSAFYWNYPYWVNLVQNHGKYSYKLNFDTKSKLNMMKVMAKFSILFRPEISFLEKFVPRIQIFLFKMKFYSITALFKYVEFDDDIHFFCFGPEKFFLEKLTPNYESCYKFLFNLFNFIMSSFCFDKLFNIYQNTATLQSSLVIGNTEENNTSKQYLA